jgi:signal recognition particle receptor subunit alpha
MQDNEPLMRALSSLINLNAPDLVLFVGEALVGNDAVDQLTKFNQRLADLAADARSVHAIDGILLTKFDTIDDKARAELLEPLKIIKSRRNCAGPLLWLPGGCALAVLLS